MTIVINRGRLSFYIKDDSVVVSNGGFQYMSFNTYALSNKGHFQKFKDTILNSQSHEFSSIVDVVELSGKYEVYGCNTSKPILKEGEYEQRQ